MSLPSCLGTWILASSPVDTTQERRLMYFQPSERPCRKVQDSQQQHGIFWSYTHPNLSRLSRLWEGEPGTGVSSLQREDHDFGASVGHSEVFKAADSFPVWPLSFLFFSRRRWRSWIVWVDFFFLSRLKPVGADFHYRKFIHCGFSNPSLEFPFNLKGKMAITKKKKKSLTYANTEEGPLPVFINTY